MGNQNPYKKAVSRQKIAPGTGGVKQEIAKEVKTTHNLTEDENDVEGKEMENVEVSEKEPMNSLEVPNTSNPTGEPPASEIKLFDKVWKRPRKLKSSTAYYISNDNRDELARRASAEGMSASELLDSILTAVFEE